AHLDTSCQTRAGPDMRTRPNPALVVDRGRGVHDHAPLEPRLRAHRRMCQYLASRPECGVRGDIGSGMDDRQGYKALADQPVVEPQTIWPADGDQKMKLAAARASAHPRAKSLFADMKRNVGERRVDARVVEHGDNLVRAVE